jgi:hypothetical protein
MAWTDYSSPTSLLVSVSHHKQSEHRFFSILAL